MEGDLPTKSTSVYIVQIEIESVFNREASATQPPGEAVACLTRTKKHDTAQLNISNTNFILILI